MDYGKECTNENCVYAERCGKNGCIEACKGKECEWIEVREFVHYVSRYSEKDFKLCKCPDKEKEDYTCDMVFADANTKEELYIEVKQVMFGFDDEKKGGKKQQSQGIALAKGQARYGELLYAVVSQADDEKQRKLDDFMAEVPREQIDEKDYAKFCEQLQAYIRNETFEEDEYVFSYTRERNGKSEVIRFKRKTDEQRRKFGNRLLLENPVKKNPEEGISIETVQGKMMDIGKLKKLIMDNLVHTDQKKFPKEAKRRILLNVLRVPAGYELFFDLKIREMIEKLMDESYESGSAANESYLLYVTDEYMGDIQIDGEFLMGKEVLFIIPLISEWLEEPKVAW